MALYPGVALVTGAGSGIGKQIAVSFAAEGCKRIAILDQDAASLAATAKAIGEASSNTEVQSVQLDVRKPADISAAIAQVISRFKRIDYAVNCAGIFGPTKATHELQVEEFDNIVSINCRGLWLCAREEFKYMMQQEPLPTHDGRPGNRGSVVNMASNLALVSKNGTPAYNASKAAVVSITRTDAIDYSKHDIRVNCVCPGVIDTPMTAGIPDDDPGVHIAPMKRKGTPQEVADVVLFLSSPKASFMQGAAVTVDGGYIVG